MEVSVRITGSLFDYTDSLIPALARVVKKATFDVEATAKTAIKTGPKTGRVYGRVAQKGSRNAKGRFRKAGRYSHQASAPGEAPASDTGFLANSIFSVFSGDKMEGEVIAGIEYAEYLEEDMNRPFLRPALESVEPGFKAAVAAVLKRKRK